MIRVLHFADLINRHDFIHNVMAFCDPQAFAMSAATLGGRGTLGGAATPQPVANLDCEPRGRWPLAVLRLRRLLVRERIDLLHAHHYAPGLIAMLAAWGSPARLVLGRHYSDAVYQLTRGAKRRLYLGLEALANRRAAAVVAPSRAVEEVLRRQRVPEAKIARIPYGFDFERFGPRAPESIARARQAWGERPGLRVATFGRLHGEKGQRFLIEALALLAGEGLRATLLVVGEGPERSTLEEQARALGLGERVWFTGWRTDPFDFMAAADVVVQPTLHEAFSQVMVEAMALGRPLVISDVSAVADVVEDGLSGLVVPPADVAALAAAMRRVSDGALAAALGGEAARRVRARLDIRSIAPQFERLYRRLVP